MRIPKLGADPADVAPVDKRQKLEVLAKKMAAAKTQEERDRITKEVDAVIGFDTGDDQYNPEALGQWEANKRRQNHD